MTDRIRNINEEIALYFEQDRFRREVSNRQAIVTPELAANLGRAYATNPNVNPEIIAAITMSGADPKVLQQISEIAAQQQIRDGYGVPSDVGQRYAMPNGPVGASLAGNLALMQENNLPQVARKVDEKNEGGDDGILGWLHDGLKGAVRGAMVISESGWQATEAFLRGVTDFDGETDLSLGDVFRNTSLYEVFRQATQEGEVNLGSGYFTGGTVRQNQAQRQRELLGTIQMPDGTTRTWNSGLGFARAATEANIIPYNDTVWNTVSGIYSAMGAVTFDPLNALGIGVAQRGATSVDNLARLGSRTGKKVNAAISAARAAEESGDLVLAMKYNDQALRALGVSDYNPVSFRSVKDRVTRLSETDIAVQGFLRDEAGFVSANGQRTVLIPEFVRFLTKDRGVRLVERMVQETDTAKIFRLHQGKIGPNLARELAQSTTPEEVIRAYAYSLGNPGDSLKNYLGFLPEMGFLNLPERGAAVRNMIGPYTRWFNYLPDSSILDPRDGMSYVNRAYDLYTTLPVGARFKKGADGKVKIASLKRYDIERRDEMVRRAIDAFADGDATRIKQLNTEIANDFQNMFVRLGWSHEEATALTRWASEQTRLSQFSLSDLQNPVDPAEAPVFHSQLLQSGATVIDPNKLQEVLRGSGRVRQMRRLNTEYHRLSDQNFDLVGQIAELEDSLLLPNITDAQRTKWTDELNDLNKKQRELQRKVDELSVNGDPTTKGFIEGAKIRGDYFMSQWWKPLTLVRAAYILRIIPEEVARLTLGGVFGLGPGAFMDYMLASMGDINGFGRVGRYEIDALGNRFSRKAGESDGLKWELQDLNDELDVARRNKNVTEIERLSAKIADVENRLDEVDESAYEMFEQAMISMRGGNAYSTVTREVSGASVTDRRLMANMSGGKNLATRSIAAQRDNWVAGLADYYVQAAGDQHLKAIARVASGRSLPKSQRFPVDGVVGNWDEHVAAGRIRDQREGLIFWMQNGSGRGALDDLVRSYAANGRVLDPDNVGDVGFILDKQVEHLSTLVGGKPADVAFSPSSLGGNAVPGELYRVIEDAEQDLLEAIATGRFDGSALKGYNRKQKDAVLNGAFRDRLKTFGDSDRAPERVLYNANRFNQEERFSFLRDRIVSPFFTTLFGVPSDKLSRSPSFRRFYWLQMEQLVRSANDAAAVRLVENAKQAGLPQNLLNRIIEAADARTVVRGEGANLKTLDEVAKGAALARVRELLYDASRRGAAMDQMRLITPFGDAWKEVWSTWTKEVVRQRGLPVKRLAKGIQGVRDSGVMEQDPITGEWHVTVPLSDKLAKHLPTIPGILPGNMEDFQVAPFTMPAQSLNVLGTFSPGVGPVLNSAVNSWIPDDPSWDAVRDWLFPVAEPAQPETEAARNNLWQQLVFPSPWMRRAAAALPESGPLGVLRNFVNDLESDPAFQATRNHVVQSLASSRPPDQTRGADNMKKLFDDANEIAKRMYFMRGVFAFIGPGAPMPRYIAETGQGNMPAALLTDEWRKLETELLAAGQPPGLAAQKILDVYGENVWLYTASNSTSLIKGAQASGEWWDWYRTGGDEIIDKYPLAGAYFGNTGDFNIDAYSSLFARGIYERKTGQELYDEAATDVAYLAYNRLRDQFPPESQRSPEQRRILASAREAIQKYWGVSLSAAERIEERDNQIREFERLIDAADQGDDLALSIMTSPAGRMLAEYMAFRQVVSEMVVEEMGGTSPTSFRQLRAAAPLRDSLRQLGERFSAQDTTFGRVYQFVLEGELFDDEDLSDLDVTPQRVSQARVTPGRAGRRGIIPGVTATVGG